MKGVTHIGIFLVIGIAVNSDLIISNEYLFFLGGGVLGSLLPDSDIKSSPAGRLIPMHLIYKHRAQTHSLFYAGVSSGLSCLINPWFGAGNMVGYILHLLCDRLTYMGRKKGLPYIFWLPGMKKRTKSSS